MLRKGEKFEWTEEARNAFLAVSYLVIWRHPVPDLAMRRVSDTSQTYLLFQTLLLLFWLHSCMIWTKLTRTDVVFSRAASAILYCAGLWIFRYAGKKGRAQKQWAVRQGK